MLSVLCGGAAATAAIPTAQARSGTTHTGTPHWVLVALVAIGPLAGFVSIGTVILVGVLGH